MKRGVLFIMLIFSLLSCNKDNNDNLDKELHVRDFIWKGLNHWYLWQKDVPDLADSRFAVSVAQTNVDNTAYANFLKSYDSPKKLFVNLLNQYQKIDRFSFITDDYTELERSFQGISLSSGMNFVLSRYGSGEGVLGVVRYVLPNSNADLQGVKRGDIFVAIDGTPLNVNNYAKLLFNANQTMRMDMARAERINNEVNIVETGVSITVMKSEITENPILVHKVITKGKHKIGYLMYNSFVANFDKALNDAFGEFKNQGVTDLVLDLRYNGGGRISSAVYLASMITGQFGGQLFAKERWNDKLQPIIDRSGASLYFADKIGATPINSLNLSKVHIITTNRTASASELVINGLKAYVDVVQVGETTLGKNEGSITVYDSRSGIDKQGINPTHKWAMQPLVLKIENARGEGNYTSGLVPSIIIAEDVANFGVLGEENEPLLAKAIQSITGFSGKSLQTQTVMPVQYLADSKSFNLAENQMYK